MRVYIIEGGAGRSAFFTALIPKLAEKEKIMIMGSYPEITEFDPRVYRSLSRATTYAWDDIVQNPEHTTVFSDPYFHDRFIKRKCHVIEAWCEQLGVEYSPDMLPEIYLSKQYKDFAKQFKEDNGNFIMLQCTSGQSALNFNQQQPFVWSGFKREYEPEQAQQLVDMLHDRYPKLKIINFCLPNERTANLKNVMMFPTGFMTYIALLEQAETFIGINSCLQHFAAAVRKPGVVLWSGTSPDQWGYKMHTNLSGKCKELYCSRPYLRELGDFVGNGSRWSCPNPTCVNIPPEDIFIEVDKILKNMVVIEPRVKPQDQKDPNCPECKK